MTNKEDGGAAYPVTFEGGSNNGENPAYHEGMSLRDYFAGQALSGLIMNPNHNAETISVAAYMAADAMLEARK